MTHENTTSPEDSKIYWQKPGKDPDKIMSVLNKYLKEEEVYEIRNGISFRKVLIVNILEDIKKINHE